MEKLFALKNILLQPLVDAYGDDLVIAYTEKLLDRNIILEFSGVSVNDDSGIPEEIGIFAIANVKNSIYLFTLFVSGEILGPLPVFRLVADAIEYIESCNKDTILSDLEEICTSVSVYDKNFENKEYYQSLVWKYNSALDLIRGK